MDTSKSTENKDTQEFEPSPQQLPISTSEPINDPTQDKPLETSQEIVNITKESTEEITNSEKLPHLRPRLVNFCEGIVSGKSQIQSYKDSGFKSKDDVIAHREAQKLLRLPHIKDYINIRQKQEQLKLIEKTHVTKEWVLNEFIASADRCKESKKEREHQTALNSINAMLGYLAPQVVDNRNTHVLDASKLSPDDLAELSEKLDKLSKDRKPAKVLKLVNEGK